MNKNEKTVSNNPPQETSNLSSPQERTETQMTSDFVSIVQQIESAFGEVERDKNGTVIGVNLAKERSSVSDDVLHTSLQIPRLKKLRVAGGAITSKTLQQIAEQKNLEELYLQETPIQDGDLAIILPKLSQLQRLTLRGCNNVTDQCAESILALLRLRSLALIKMNLTRQGLEKIIKSQTITALDLRQCSALTAQDYTLLAKMPQLSDLKIGGFAVEDSVLETVTQLSKLTGLTIEDAMISSDGFAKIAANQNWTQNITLLVLARDTMLFDAGLEPLKNFPKLKRLSINGMMITGEFLAVLAVEESKRPKLETLSLQRSLLTPEGVAALKNYRELKSLDLTGVTMTQDVAKTITALETLETLNLSDCQLDNEIIQPIRNMKSLKTLILNGNPLLQNP
ncbi:MAG: hypothetical protein LBJ67_09935 [Planctomycetaceae bacterium]|nr:hypothetical protein [Planctomycetaceae bacterium]